MLIGRHLDIINIGGKKVTPDEIENAARKVAGIVDCGCVGIADPLKGQAPKLFVAMEQGYPFDPVSIKKQLADYLELYKIPEEIKAAEHLPRNFNGKQLRGELVNL